MLKKKPSVAFNNNYPHHPIQLLYKMGEIADSLINGEFDFFTGEYIGRPIGMPRTMDGSLPWEKRRPAFNGVMNYVMKKGLSQQQVDPMLRKYAEFKGWEIGKKKFIRKCSAKIQQDWNGFCNWFAQYKKLTNNGE